MRTPTLLLIITFLAIGCASRGVPGGGPADIIPPVILSTTPQASALEVQDLNAIHIHFSEDMNEATAVNKIYISPPLKPEISWPNADELVLNLNKELSQNQTYVITLGRDLSDLRGNKMTATFQLAFSTGPKLDKGVIAGAVPALKSGKTVSIFAFPLSPQGLADIDSTAMYVSQTGKGGKYQINYMRFGSYRLFAVDDQNNNLKIDAAFESIGIPFKDVWLDSLSPSFSGLNFRMTQIDTSAPEITRLQSLSNRQLKVYLSEAIVMPSLAEISIRDSISNDKKEVLLLGREPSVTNALDVFTAALDSARVYRLSVAAIRDSNGNAVGNQSRYFTARGKTTFDSLKVIKVYPADSTRNVGPNAVLKFAFSTPLVDEALRDKILLVSEKGDTVIGKMHRDDEKQFSFHPAKNLLFDTWYKFNLSLIGVSDVAGQLFPDSSIARSFKVNSIDGYGSLSGKVWATGLLPRVFFVVSAKAIKGAYKQKNVTGLDHTFQFPYLPGGKYSVSAFADKDSNRVYSPGKLYPFQYSEPFIIAPDTVSIRKRWETNDFHLDFPAYK